MSRIPNAESEAGLADIAIVGMAGRFPLCADLDEYWRKLRDGVECVSFFTREECLAAGARPEELDRPQYVRAAAIVDGTDLFDADFFGFSPADAEILDPQHRLFLECSADALADAGYDPARFPGPIGVFAGCGFPSYLVLNILGDRERVDSAGLDAVAIGADKDYLATRVSYKLDLRGPSIAVQAACSTSLVAVHEAVVSLLTHQCDMALAGGVTVLPSQKAGYLYQPEMIRSPDGHCRAFDAAARGTMEGEGVGVVVLKRLADAKRDGDTIAAVVKGSAVNNDGAGKVGYTAPRKDGQAEAIALAQAVARVDAESIGFIEAHGTGTALGDPIEIAALTAAFRAHTAKTGFCAVSSAKTAIGHLGAAAGIAGLIRAVLALQHRCLPPNLHFRKSNPQIELAGSPFYISAEARPWPRGATPRRAGVSSFGVGGTNAHVVLEEAPPGPAPAAAAPWQLLLLSAHQAGALEDAARHLGEYLDRHPELDLADAAYTLQVGRRRCAHRRAILCESREVAIAVLAGAAAGRSWSGDGGGGRRPVAFLIPDREAWRPEAGAELYRTEPLVRELIDRAAGVLGRGDGDLLAAVQGAPRGRGVAAETFLFALEVALGRLWASWGVEPQAILGQGLGEYAAACLAGVFDFEDALRLVADRSRLARELPAAATLAAGAGQRAPSTEAIIQRFAAAVARAAPRPPRVPFVSSVTGRWIRPEEVADPAYWVRHLGTAVSIAEGLGEIRARPDWALLEVGAGRTLSSLAAQHPEPGPRGPVVSSLPLEGTEPAIAQLLEAAGRLWAAGVDLGPSAPDGRRRVPLPGYPFQRRRFWIDPPRPREAPASRDSSAPVAGAGPAPVADWFWLPSWQRTAPPGSASLGRLSGNRESWLVCGPADPDAGAGPALALRLVRRLADSGQRVVRAVPGDGFGQLADGTYCCRPGRPEDHEALLAAVGPPERILYLWSLGAGGADAVTIEDRSFWGPMNLARALQRTASARPAHLLAIVERLRRVTGTEPVEPAQALSLGPFLTLPLEDTRFSGAVLDLDLGGGDDLDLLADRILAEALVPGDPIAAYRGGHRWIPTLQPIDVDRVADATSTLRQGGVYLVTGGLGGVGAALAGHLARAAGARLILTGRSELPPRERWPHWLASHDASDRTTRRIQRLLDLERRGAEVLAVAADVADAFAMSEALRRANDRFGEIQGLIHAAGVAGGGLIQLKRREEAAAVLAPKVAGLRVLDQLLDLAALDFAVLCSSKNALVPNPGQSDYMSANAYLDAFAHSRSGRGRIMALNWDTWREVGMALETEVPAQLRDLRELQLRRGIPTAQGEEAFGLLLRVHQPQIAISTVDPGAALARPAAARRRSAVVREPGSAAPARSTGPPAQLHPRPALGTPFAAPRDDIEATIAGIWSDLLGLAEVGIDDDFFALGGHSLLGTRVLALLQTRFGLTLPLRQIFESSTVARLADAVRAGVSGEGRPATAEVDQETIEL